jgi:hypothetical protein
MNTATGLEQMIVAINAAYLDLQKSNEWFAERDFAIRSYVGGNSEWASWDDEASALALLDIQAALQLPADECKSRVQRIIAGLIQHAATGHSNQMERNGRLG